MMDRTARPDCIWCGEELPEIAARFGDVGYACSDNCYARFMGAFWRVQEPWKYGTPSPEDRIHVGHVHDRSGFDSD